MRLRWAIPVLGLVLVARAATAQDPRLAARLLEPDRARVQAVLDSARVAGLPVEPLIDRALEGAAKRAPGDRIVLAVQRLRDELASARDALGARASTAELTAGASALRAGARPEDLGRLRELRSPQSVTVAAGVLADIVAVGAPPDSATAALLSIAAQVDDAELLAFRRNVERDVAMGASPITALGVRLSGLAGLRAIGEAGAPISSSPSGPRKP
jgi:hypothetical protein